MGQFITAQCISRGTEFDGIPAGGIRRLVDEDYAVINQPFECLRAIVGEGTDNLPIVKSVIRKAVRFNY